MNAAALALPLTATLLLAGCTSASKSSPTTSSGTSQAAATQRPKPSAGQFVSGGQATTEQLAITLVRIVDPFTPSNPITPTRAGNRDVLIDTAIINVGTFQATVNRSAFSLKTSDNRMYTPLIVLTGHDLAVSTLSHAERAEGDVVFEIPVDATIRQLRYTAESGNADLSWTAP